jgi:hypothetical protein
VLFISQMASTFRCLSFAFLHPNILTIRDDVAGTFRLDTGAAGSCMVTWAPTLSLRAFASKQTKP